MYEAIVIGASVGGHDALKVILTALPASFPLPIAAVQHIGAHAGEFYAQHLHGLCNLTVKEAEDKEPLQAGHVYLAPAGYHLLIESNRTFSLSVDARVNYSRPSIDVLFESAADAIGPSLIGMVLTGGNADGTEGLRHLKQFGGLAIVQNPFTAYNGTMPRAALQAVQADHILELSQIAPLLIELTSYPKGAAHAAIAKSF